MYDEAANRLEYRRMLRNNLMKLLCENTNGIPYKHLEDSYQRKFQQSLLADLLPIALPELISQVDFLDGYQECKNSIAVSMKLKPEVYETLFEDWLFQVTSTGPVPKSFKYTPNPITISESKTFLTEQVILSPEGYLCVRPKNSADDLVKLQKELNEYYSHSISDRFRVKDLERGLAYVVKYQNDYRRILIQATQMHQYLVEYVDHGLTETVAAEELQCKHLLHYFGSVPIGAIRCSLAHECSMHDNGQIATQKMKAASEFSQEAPLSIELLSQTDQIWYADIRDTNKQEFPANYILNQQISQDAIVPTQGSRDVVHLDDQSSQNRREVPQRCNPLEDYEESDRTKISPDQQPLANSDQSSYDLASKKKNNGIKIGIAEKPNNQRSKQDHKRPDTSRNGLGAALLKRAINSVKSQESNRQQNHERKSVHPVEKANDLFLKWMDSSAKDQTLWRHSVYGEALLSYLGKIYDKKLMEMRNLFETLTKTKSDVQELDLLHQLIETINSERDAEKSLKRWESNTRIQRRLKDIECILSLDGNPGTRNRTFTVTYPGSWQRFHRESISTYFDLGCGNGVITAQIGAYLKLSKHQIFGSDVFDPNNPDFTFIPIDQHQNTIPMNDQSVDLITCFVTLHHVPDLRKTLNELARILRPGGYFIIREHDSDGQYSIVPKYLNFVHAIMMIAKVGEFADVCDEQRNMMKSISENDEEDRWKKQKQKIIEFTKSIQYRTSQTWDEEFQKVGFTPCAKFDYSVNGSPNPQHLFYAIYRLSLDNKYPD